MGRKTKIIISFVVCLFGISTLGHAAPPISQKKVNKLPHISASQAYALYKSKKVILLDVHDVPEKKQSSIVGAYYFPSKKIEKSKVKLPKNMLIGVF